MKKIIILVMLSGVLTLHVFAREKYRILVRKESDGREIFIPSRKEYNGGWFKEWVEYRNIYYSKESAEKVIEEWREQEKNRKEYNKRRYIYLN
jgi:hypothetical protein